MRYVTFVKLSDEGRKRFPEAAALFGKTIEISEHVGGKLVDAYSIAGHYDFVSVWDYPTPEAAFEARIKSIELGIFDTLEAYEAFDMDLFLSKV